MTNHRFGLLHQLIRRRIYKKYEPYPHPDQFKRFMDKVIYVVVIVGPIMNLPQLFKIWGEQDAGGVSLISWMSFSVMSLIWVVYGILHKQKPILFMNAALMVIQGLIATGAYIYG